VQTHFPELAKRALMPISMEVFNTAVHEDNLINLILGFTALQSNTLSQDDWAL